jgi:O-acetyl-ADP-ribose deacetylase (regulator of RNase III)
MEQGGRSYSVNQSTITLIPGDITASRAEAIVSSDDGDISRGGGVSLAIAQAAHGPMDDELRKHIPAKVGDVVVTSAAGLPAKYILHAITLPSWSNQFWRSDPPSGAVVRSTVQRIMELLPLLRCHSVAFPVIGAGVAGVSYEDAAKEMCEVLVRSLLHSERQIHVELYLHDRFQHRKPEELAALFDAHLQNSLGIEIALRKGQPSLVVPTAEDKSDAGQRPSGEQRRREIYDMLLHLARRRDRLEADLLAALLGRNGAT